MNMCVSRCGCMLWSHIRDLRSDIRSAFRHIILHFCMVELGWVLNLARLVKFPSTDFDRSPGHAATAVSPGCSENTSKLLHAFMDERDVKL